jgi:2-haloacid dehalogenase
MNRRYSLITFDVYTALLDIESSLTPLASEILQFEALNFVRAWRRKQLEYALISNSLRQGRLSFDLITLRALDDTLARSNLDLSESSRILLLNQWLNLEPWNETPSVLSKIKSRGYTLALLSNGDMTQLQTLSKKLPPVFDHIFSSEEAGHYKPHPSVYALPLDKLHLKADEVLHVAGSPTDALGTKAAGLHCAWSNRNHEVLLDPSCSVDYNMQDLNQLLEIL